MKFLCPIGFLLFLVINFNLAFEFPKPSLLHYIDDPTKCIGTHDKSLILVDCDINDWDQKWWSVYNVLYMANRNNFIYSPDSYDDLNRFCHIYGTTETDKNKCRIRHL